MESIHRSDCPKRLNSDRPVRVAYQSGAWIPAEELSISVTDLGFSQAVTAVERIRAYGGKLFQLDRHLERWVRTTEALFIEGLPKAHAIGRLITEAISKNADSLKAFDDFGVLLLASPGGAGDNPTLIIDLYEIDATSVELSIKDGSPLVITDVQQPSSNCWPRDIKVRCRLHYYLADKQAGNKTPHAYGVLLDADGTITETSIANLLIVERGTLISPEREQILPGVSLHVVRQLAEAANIPFVEQRITAGRFREADEVILTGTRCGIWFCNSVDGATPKNPGVTYRRLRQAFEDLVLDDAGR